jgi:hypothetical protein
MGQILDFVRTKMCSATSIVQTIVKSLLCSDYRIFRITGFQKNFEFLVKLFIRKVNMYILYINNKLFVKYYAF